MSDVAYNYKSIAFYGILVFIGAIVVLYFLKINPFHSAINAALSWVSTTIGKVGVGGIGELITKNWATILGFGAMAVPLIYTTIKGQLTIAAKNEEIKNAKELAELTQASSETTISQVKTSGATQIQDLQAKLTQYENDPALGMLQKSYSQLQTEKMQLQGQINLLNQKLEAEIQKRPVITQTVVK